LKTAIDSYCCHRFFGEVYPHARKRVFAWGILPVPTAPPLTEARHIG
jgi:hypothetical protein